MKKLLKRIGRLFIELRQKSESDLRQSVLLVDGSFILPNNFALITKDVKKRFRNAKLVILTFKDKKEFIKDNFPDVEIIVPADSVRPKKYQLAVQLFFLLRRKFSFLVLSSLDISLLIVALTFCRCPVFLHNRWLEWYKIKQRTLSDILCRAKSADINRRRTNIGIKQVIKSLGRIFVFLPAFNEEDIKYRLLILDNGYTEIGHVLTAVRRAEEIFINPHITILTLAQRKQDFLNNFPQTKLEIVENTGRYVLAMRMYRMRQQKFNCVILTALDISPILVSFLFMNSKVLLYNRWHQWWSLGFRNIFGYIKNILYILVMIPIVIYLLIATGFILFRTSLRTTLINLRLISKKRR